MGPRRGLWMMLAVCGVLGLSHSPRDARAQQVDAAEREFFLLLERLGGEYGADAELESGDLTKFLSVITFEKHPRDLDDDGLLELRRKPEAAPRVVGIQKIVLRGTKITDRGLAALRGLQRLEVLDLSGTRVTDEGVDALVPTLPRMRFLTLGRIQQNVGTGRTELLERRGDGSLPGRAGAGRDAAAPRTGGRGRDRPGARRDRAHVRAGGAEPGPDEGHRHGVAHVAANPTLRMLSLNETGITDAGLAHLAGHPKLESLHLLQTQVTDAGLAHLASLPRMRSGPRQQGKLTVKPFIDLSRTGVTPAGAAKLREQLPQVDIFAVPRADAGRPGGAMKADADTNKGRVAEKKAGADKRGGPAAKRKGEVEAKAARKPSGLTAEQRARSSLNLGKTYLGQKKLEMAREYLERVVELVPGSSMAKEAQELLRGMGK